MDEQTELERFKRDSGHLRGNLDEDVRSDALQVSGASKQLLKFHGLYEQDDRDLRARLRHEGKPKHYSFMVRSRLPGGRLTASQYLAHDDLATRHGNGSLRITARQDLQIHGVLRGDLTGALRSLNRQLVTTLGACGDLVRNVMSCPAPEATAARREIEPFVRGLSDHFLPRTRAYHELWLGGERVEQAPSPDGSVEPIYGASYLPRKFKIGVAFPGDNCVDVYTHDVGLLPVVELGRLRGFNVLVGGGLGVTHNKPETFPRLGDPLGFVSPERLIEVVEQIVLIQRDHGDRTDRRHARLKYLIHDRGLDWLRRQIVERLGGHDPLTTPRETPPVELELHLGWRPQGDGRFYLGIPIENGRIRDLPGAPLKTTLRTLIADFRPGVALTAHQDLLLTDLEAGHRATIEGRLTSRGIRLAHQRSSVRLHSMACPALPTCGLALAEAERALPSVIDGIEIELRRLGLEGEKLAVRMTGCPNGCARPYVADLAFVGRSADRYQILVGGRSQGTRLNQVFRDLVPRDSLVAAVVPLFWYFRESRKQGESFGDFCDRVGMDALRERGQPLNPRLVSGMGLARRSAHE